jgi:hypothetical protein
VDAGTAWQAPPVAGTGAVRHSIGCEATRWGRTAGVGTVGWIGEVGGDDRVELGTQQLVVGTGDVGERRGRGARRVAGMHEDASGDICGVIGHVRIPPLTVLAEG